MSNTYRFPFLNPIRFHQRGGGNFFYNEIPSGELQIGYNQIYLHGDRPCLQIKSSYIYAVIHIMLIDINETVYKTWAFPYAGTYGAEFIYQWYGSFPTTGAGSADGIYFLKIEISDTDGTLTFYSEPINLCTTYENLVGIEYTHVENNFDMRFVPSSTFLPLFYRVVAGMKSEGFQPGGKFTMFQDQDYVSEVLQSQPFNIEKWIFGDSGGIPNHAGDLINRIFGLSTVKIDGVQYSRNESAKIERHGEASNPLAPWSLDLIKKENPYSESFSYIAGTNALTADSTLITADDDTISADQTLY